MSIFLIDLSRPIIYFLKYKLFQFLPFQLFVKPQLKSYLKSVLRGLKWYTKHNKPTPRNHFGKLAWFS